MSFEMPGAAYEGLAEKLRKDAQILSDQEGYDLLVRTLNCDACDEIECDNCKEENGFHPCTFDEFVRRLNEKLDPANEI